MRGGVLREFDMGVFPKSWEGCPRQKFPCPRPEPMIVVEHARVRVENRDPLPSPPSARARKVEVFMKITGRGGEGARAGKLRVGVRREGRE